MVTKKKKVAIYSISTGNFSVFVKNFFVDIQSNFLIDCEKHFFICSDVEYKLPHCVKNRVSFFRVKDLPFPGITLNRFGFFNEHIANHVTEYDYIFFMNINTRCGAGITQYDINLNKDYTFVLHDCHLFDDFKDKPFETNPNSTAYISNSKNADYIGGRFFGAKPINFVQMARKLAINIATDYIKNIVALWHDESHLNCFFNKNKKHLSFNLLPIEYHVQEQHKEREYYNGCKLWCVDKNKKRYKSIFSEIQKQKKVIGESNLLLTASKKSITFLIPPLVEDDARCGGFRTIFRMVNYMQEKKYLVNIEICGDYKTTKKEQKRRIDRYNEISQIEKIQLYFEENLSVSNVYIATGWQTHKKVNFYKSKNKLVGFFCQDLEWEFGAVQLCETRIKNCKDFYATKIPTFTMSKFLKSKFTDDRKIYSLSLNVNPDVFKFEPNIKKNGICLLYAPVKEHRLPELVLKLTNEVAKKHPSKNVYLYGDDTMMDLDIKSDNIKLLGTLTAEETAELYKKCELGVIFSTTNPSRIAFEMVACGTPAIEADCEYTKYDMDSDAFVRLNTEFDVIMNKIDELFADSNEMKRLQTECEIYSKNNFYKNAEEKLFYEFVEEGIVKKKHTKLDDTNYVK